MDELDGILQRSGAEWRRNQRPAAYPDFEIVRARSKRRWTSRAWLASVLLIGSFVGLIVLAQVVPAVTDRLARPGEGAPRVVQYGDDVAASGYIVQKSPDNTAICLPLGQRLGGEARPPTCSSVAVPLVGLDPAGVPGWSVLRGVGFAPWVTVHGTWTTDGVRVATVSIREPSSALPVPTPCATPSGGWPAAVPTTLQGEAAVGQLNAIAFGDTANYAGAWLSVTAESRSVMVVGTINDPAKVSAELSSLYPYALCVVRTDHSLAELQGAQEKLAKDDATQTDLDYARNRVRVVVSVLDKAAWDRLAWAAELIVLDPLVKPDDPAA